MKFILSFNADTSIGSIIKNDRSSEKEKNLRQGLRKIFQNGKLPVRRQGEILKLLSGYGLPLPMDPRTLMRTPRNVIQRNVGKGKYGHIGIALGINRLSSLEVLKCTDTVSVQIHIDGIEPFNSSKLSVWPILCRVVEPVVSTPFVVGVYAGKRKPRDVNDFLEDVISEINRLTSTGLSLKGSLTRKVFQINGVICDTPARSFVKRKPDHGGYNSCDKCKQRGFYYAKRMTYADHRCELLTDRSFRERESAIRSPFESISTIDMVEQFPLDYMHVVCLGVCRKFISYLIDGPGKSDFRLKPSLIDIIDEDLKSKQPVMRNDFGRVCRGWQEYKSWKAAEFRQFLLYLGPVVLKNRISRDMYDNFMELSISIYILCHPTYHSYLLKFARSLLYRFVSNFEEIFGLQSIVYNVHALTHLCDDVEKYGPLDQFSAFAFESYLFQVKQMIKSPRWVVSQIVKRCMEADCSGKILTPGDSALGCIQGNILRNIPNDNVAILCDGKYFKVTEVKSTGESSMLQCHQYNVIADFWDLGITSSRLGISVVSGLLPEVTQVHECNVEGKCILLPWEGQFVAVPLLHTCMIESSLELGEYL